MKGVWIGTSGWVYKHWAKTFYPATLPKAEEFNFYAMHFPTVEINATFYRLPTPAMVKGWHEKSPPEFLFAVKGSRFITHIKRLNCAKTSMNKYFQRITPLKEKLGPILWQLPPNFMNTPENQKRLKKFVTQIPDQLRHAVEFRHPSWFEAGTFALLEKHQVANVWLSSKRMPMDFSITSDLIYLRFHGLERGAAHDYTDHELKPWVEQLLKATREGIPAFVYFNNDLNTRAPFNAKRLMEMLGQAAIQSFAQENSAFFKAPKMRTSKTDFNEPRSKRLGH